MQFDEDFSCITDGDVKSVHLGSESEVGMSKFGRELVYINVGFVEQPAIEGSTTNCAMKVRSLRDRIHHIGQRDDGTNLDLVSELERFCRLFQTAQNNGVSYPRSSQR